MVTHAVNNEPPTHIHVCTQTCRANTLPSSLIHNPTQLLSPSSSSPFSFPGYFFSRFSSNFHLFYFSFCCPFISIIHEYTEKRIDRCLTPTFLLTGAFLMVFLSFPSLLLHHLVLSVGATPDNICIQS